jgi:hypothetical protein
VIRTITTLALSAIVLTGCGGSSDDAAPQPPAKTTPSATASASSVTTPWREAAASDAGAAFRSRLADISPALDDDRSLRRVLDTCLDLSEGKDEAAVRASTAQRFAGDSTGPLDDDQAAAIVKAATDYICTDL